MALPWFPAEQVTMPPRRSASVARERRKNAPRILNEPVICSDSSFNQVGTPSFADSPGDASTGVRRMRGRRNSRASLIRSRLSCGIAEGTRRSSRQSTGHIFTQNRSSDNLQNVAGETFSAFQTPLRASVSRETFSRSDRGYAYVLPKIDTHCHKSVVSTGFPLGKWKPVNI